MRSVLIGSLLAATIAGAYADSSAIERLKEGNERFIHQKMLHPRIDSADREGLENAQRPFAAILSCSDSRVPPEIVFDQGLGDLFTVRIAGNVVKDVVLGSLEYAVLHLKTKAIVVMGHTHCGAVKAAIAGERQQNHIDVLIESIHPAVALARKDRGDLETNAVYENVRQSMREIVLDSPALKTEAAAGRLSIFGAVYNLTSGEVEFIK